MRPTAAPTPPSSTSAPRRRCSPSPTPSRAAPPAPASASTTSSRSSTRRRCCATCARPSRCARAAGRRRRPDDRTVAAVVVEQIEGADVVVVGGGGGGGVDVEGLVARLNPAAAVVGASPSAAWLFGAARFSLARGEGWPVGPLAADGTAAGAGDGDGGSDGEFASVAFRCSARAPLGPARLHAALRRAADGGVVRLRGVVWLATRPVVEGVASLAGAGFTLSAGAPWWAAVDEAAWPAGLRDELAPRWREPHGDRRTELVCVGLRAMPKPRRPRSIRACSGLRSSSAARRRSTIRSRQGFDRQIRVTRW